MNGKMASTLYYRNHSDLRNFIKVFYSAYPLGKTYPQVMFLPQLYQDSEKSKWSL